MKNMFATNLSVDQFTISFNKHVHV